jgi:hypothetical protein
MRRGLGMMYGRLGVVHRRRVAVFVSVIASRYS